MCVCIYTQTTNAARNFALMYGWIIPVIQSPGGINRQAGILEGSLGYLDWLSSY